MTQMPTIEAYGKLVGATETGGEAVGYEAIPQAYEDSRPLVQPETGAEMAELYWRALDGFAGRRVPGRHARSDDWAVRLAVPLEGPEPRRRTQGPEDPEGCAGTQALHKGRFRSARR